MKTHTTKNGDSFVRVRNHILESTPWTREAYRPPSRKLAGDRASDVVTGLAALVGVVGILALAYYATTK